MGILLKNATYIDWETLEFKSGNILVDQNNLNQLRWVDTTEQYESTETIDCAGKLVTKSFVNAHHHIYSALARGMEAPPKSPENFLEILQYVWWRLDKSLDKDMIYASALYAAMQSAKTGATFIIDHHASPNFIRGSLDTIARAFNEVGVSHLLCYEITDRDGMDKANEGLLETEQYISQNQGLVGLHASFTVGNETMQKAADIMNKYKSGVHIHVAEDKYDQDHCIKSHQKRVVERLNDFGMLNSSKSLLIHALHLEEKEREIIKNSSCWVVENRESNLNNQVGNFNGANLGDRIMLGTDGMHSDMLQSAKFALFAGMENDNIDFASVYQRFRNPHKYLRENNFVGDGDNNLVILDYDSPTPLTKENLYGHFSFGLNSTHVEHVISNGNIIIRDGKPTRVDESDVLKFSKEQAQRLWKDMRKIKKG